MIPPLYEHQKKIIEADKHKCGLFLGTGASKTRTALELAEGKTLVICPKQQREDKTWERENEKWGTKVDLKVISKEDLRKMWDTLPGCTTLIIDECFIKGTKVLTDNGYKNIEDIRRGDNVANAIGWGEVTNTIINKSNEIYKISLSNGKNISVTGNHPFFTNEGWVNAEDLNNSHLLMSYDMLTLEYEKQKTKNTFVHNLRKADSAWMASRWPLRPVQKDLFTRMCEKARLELYPMYLVQPNGRTKIVSFKEMFGENEKEQSYVDGWGKRKSNGDPKKEWLQTCVSQKRKRARNAITSKNIISSIRRWMDSGISCSDKSSEDQWLSDMLQNRYSKPERKNINRGGRKLSRQSEGEKNGLEKRGISEIIRVENIKIQKQDGVNVYNLSVSGHPSYFAEGILVHNCHNNLGVMPAYVQRNKVQIPKTSQIFEATKNFIDKHPPKRLYLLSATPVPKPMSMWGIGILFGKKWDFSEFRSAYYIEIRMGGVRRIWMPKKDEATKQRLANLVQRFGYTGGLNDFFDVPEQTHKNVEIDLSADQKKAVEDITLSEADPLVRRARLRTIENGVLYGKKIEKVDSKTDLMTKNTIIFKSHKIDYILERAQEFPKMLIFANYTAQIEEIAKALRKEKYKVSILNGATKDRSFIKTVDDSPEPHIIIAQCSISSGYELPSFPCVIYASKSWRYVDYEQSLGRVLRSNKLKKNLYIHLVVEGCDKDCHDTIMSGQDFQEKLSLNI